MHLRTRRPMIDRGRRSAVPLAVVAAVCALTVVLAGCSKDGTTTVEPATTAAPKSSTSSTLATSQEGVDAIVATWVQAGFSEDQARCLVEQMNEISSGITSTDAESITPAEQNLIEQLMKECEIDDAALRDQLGG